jgi:hypothetical protein
MDQLIDVILTEEIIATINDGITIVKDALEPVMKDISIDDKKRLQKMGDEDHGFVTETLELAKQEIDNLPRNFDPAYMERDITLWDQLHPIRTKLLQIVYRIDSTMAAAGHDAIMSGLDVYYHLKRNGKDASLEKLVDYVGRRFAHKPKPEEDETPPSTEETK